MLRALIALVMAGSASFAAQFGTAVVDDPLRGDVRFVVLGDFNGSYGATSYPAPLAGVIRAITEVWSPDAVLFTGDVVAGQSRSLSRELVDAMWQGFDRHVAGPLRQAGIPYALTVGNHDASSLRGAGGYTFALDRDAAAAYWSDSRHRTGLELHDAANLPFRYSFTVGDAFIAMLDASSATVDAEQRFWLTQQLASEPARTATVRLVLGHLPLVPVSVGRETPGEFVTEAVALTKVLKDGCADAYVSGHHAAYYPAVWEGLEMIAAGGIGAKRLLGHGGAPRSTVTVIDVWREPASIAYTTFDAVTLELLNADDLPASLPSGPVLSTRATERAPLHCGG